MNRANGVGSHLLESVSGYGLEIRTASVREVSTMKKRLASIFTALALCAAFVPVPAWGEAVTASGGLADSLEQGGSVELGNSCNEREGSDCGILGAREGAAANGAVEVSKASELFTDVANGGEIKLMADITIDASLVTGEAVTLDLNGHVLKYENDQTLGSVIKVSESGNLTIKDSNPTVPYKFMPNSDGLWVLDENGTEEVKGGIITGGTGTPVDNDYQTFGGGVYVSCGGKLTMEGGSIVGCKAVSKGRAGFGGGVYLYGDYNAGVTSSFIMNGGGIVGCTAELGGGVGVDPICELVMNSGVAIRDCVARNGGGVYINSALDAPGKFTLNGGSVLSCRTTKEMHCRGGGVSNEGTFIMTKGEIKDCIAYDADSSGGVYNTGEFTMLGGTIDGNVAGSGTTSLTVGVSEGEEFLAALANKNVATIRLLKGDVTVDGGDALTIDRPITIVNGSGNAGCSLYLHRSLTIAKDGVLALEDKVSFYPVGNVTVEGGLTVGSNCGVLFEVDNSSLMIREDGVVQAVAAGEDANPGELSLGAGVALTVNGKLVNEGVLSVSDMENLKKAADVGGDLRLNRMTVTEDYALDMKGGLLIISESLNFEPGANLTVKNASKVSALGAEISGGSYYCPVYAGDEPSPGNENAISGGSFYGPVTLRHQGRSGGATPSVVSGGTFYGTVEGGARIAGGTFYESVKLTGWSDSTYVSGGTFYNELPVDSDGKPVSIDGRVVTFMNDGAKYAMQVVCNGKATAPDVPNKAGYTFAGWYTEDGKKFDFGNARVTDDIALTAKWAINSSSRYAIVVSDEPSHGTVAVSAKYAYRGATVTITVAPDAGYTLETLVATDARGNELVLTDKGDGTFTFVMPGSRVEVRASFMDDNSLLSLFYDVPNDAYFYEAVKWAVSSGIAQGYGNGMFGPEDPCTRGQVVTFLWRAAGCLEPSAPSSFSDVSQDAYYAKAVAWAVEAGVAHGYSSDAFGPDDVCTRAQAATFLWRAAGSPESAASSGFADVVEDAYYAGAVAWAAENGIAYGYDNGSFGPDDGCTRDQAVTFLWRANS